MFDSLINNTEGSQKSLDIPEITMTASLVFSVVLVVVGVMMAGGIATPSNLAWTVVGGSVAITALSLGALAPVSIVTFILGVLSLSGVLSFTSAGIGIAITLTVGLIAGCCLC